MSVDGKEISGEARDVLAYWRAVELFSPQPVPGRAKDRVCELDGGPLPWEPGHPLAEEWLRSTNVWQHYVYVGVYSLDEAYAALRAALSDHEQDEDGDPQRAGESALAAFAVGYDGRAILGSQTLSSCAWALGRAFTRSPEARGWLTGFERATGEFAHRFEALVSADEDDVQARELGEEGHRVGGVVHLDLLDEIKALLVELLGVEDVSAAATITGAHKVRVQSRPVGHANCYRPRSRDFLNSFVAGDLDRVASALAREECGPALQRYLSGGGWPTENESRFDTDLDLHRVRSSLSPSSVPLGRWPRAVAQTADTGQQLAINTSVNIDNDPQRMGRLLSVNGPPGTGKTTMLRDLIAALVVERAQQLAELDTPEDAFAPTPIEFHAGGRKQRVYPLKRSLTGYEIVLACATNAAAENVSREIPLAQAIAPEWHDRIDYFTDVATTMLRGQSENGQAESAQAWGLLAAPLGSIARCQAFATAFWFGGAARTEGNGDGAGALAAATGLLDILKSHSAKPSTWKEAVTEFEEALARTRTAQQDRQAYAQVWQELEDAQQQAERCASQLEQARSEYSSAETRLAKTAAELAPREEQHRRAVQAHQHHRARRPHLHWLLPGLRPAARAWREREQAFSEALALADSALGETRKRHAEMESALARHAEEVRRHEQGQREAHERIERLHAKTAVDAATWEREHPDAVYPSAEWVEDSGRTRRELRAPWLDTAWDTARTEAFLAALELHRAFVLGAAKKLKRSLSVAIDAIQNSSRGEIPNRVALAAWESLFLVIPVISTTFASYPRLFRHLERESLGWLVIDEAGQSSPQNAAGPIWRSRNVLIVGDPMQLEPIVTLPLRTQRDLQQAHRVPDDLLPYRSSVQSVADRVCPIGAYRGSDGELWVGSPLSVHRRCEQPMFEIVNRIAYDEKMIEHTPERAEGQLPPSRWLHVTATGQAEGHWIPTEGAVLELLLSELVNCGEPFPDTFLISPFRDIANRLAKYSNEYPLTTGTVHTAQGREADVVVLVLGGSPNRTGDKRWASQRPNLLNVAVSRAKRRLYVIGNHDVWSNYRYFNTLAARLPVEGKVNTERSRSS
jgi:hypothetical protein